MNQTKSNKAITLITLIIIIIILLILAGVTLSFILKENGIYDNAKISVEKYKNASAMEEATYVLTQVQMEMIADKTITAPTLADYVIENGVIIEEQGQIYEDSGEFFYESNDGIIVQLKNDNGVLSVDKVIKKIENKSSGRIMYDLNGGEGVKPRIARAKYGDNVVVDTEKILTREGYIFLGWALTSDAVDAITEFTMPESNVTLYAVWDRIITITYHANGGKFGDESTTKIITTGHKDIVFPTVTQSGKTYKGWYTAESGGEQIVNKNDIDPNADNMDLFAQWFAPAVIQAPSSDNDKHIVRDGFGSIGSYDGTGPYSPKYAFDGVYDLKCAGGSGASIGKWIGWDFEEPVYVTKVEGKLRMKGYIIQYGDSTNGPWTNVVSGTLSASDYGDNFSNTITNYEDIGKHRYWILCVNGGQRVSYYGALVFELKFYAIK